MCKIKNLAVKIAAPISAALYVAVALAASPTPPTITPPDVSNKQVTGYGLNTAWTQIGIYVNWAVGLVGIASVVFLMYGAYMYMSAGQNEENLKKAKASVMYGIIGAIVAVLSFSVFSLAKNLIGGEAAPACPAGLVRDPATGVCRSP